MRVNLVADVKDVPVPWFLGHLRARWKRNVCDIGQIEFSTCEYARIGRLEPQTFYLCKRPNCFRIYDKIAEYRHQYERLCRGNSDAAELPDFKDLYGYPRTGLTVTRVERQIGGDRIPAQLETFGSLHFAALFNPFEGLDFVACCGGNPELRITTVAQRST